MAAPVNYQDRQTPPEVGTGSAGIPEMPADPIPGSSEERAYPYVPTPDTTLCQGADGKLCGDEPDMSWLGEGAMVVLVSFAIVGLAGFVFWLLMLIHAIKHPIANKVIWILGFVFFGLITAILYYFVVKRSYVSTALSAGVPPTPNV